MSVDKNQAIIEYLSECPTVSNNKLFFNFADETANSNQVFAHGDDTVLNKPFVDGSVEKLYTFTIFIYKSVSYNPVAKVSGHPDENVTDLSDAQALIDWVTEQNEQRHFPNFGNECIIDSVESLTNSPVLKGVDAKAQPPLAQYRRVIRVTYLDQSKKIWS